ncbi:MAG TPA: glycosyltransferase family 39 protein [Solirubrobacterales bacterium]|nr:glycosyltransferase family 39 protein [Solirubrobacterales bacterium]
MEAASLRRGVGETFAQSLAEAVRARSRAFWIVVGLTMFAAALRFATLGLQSYHHDEVVTASRILRGSFGHAMDAVGFSESAPPLYYALAWGWTQVTGTGEWGLRALSAVAGVATVPVVYLIGLELRGRRAGLMAAALAAVNPMLLWYSQEARAYALLALFCALSLLYFLRAQRYGRRRDLTLWGVFSALALATHYFALFPIAAEILLLARRRGRESLRGLWIIAVACLLLAPLAIHQMSYGHAEWIGVFSLGHRLWETAATFVSGETGDIIGQPERPPLAFIPLGLCLTAFALLALRGDRDERRAAGLPLTVGAIALGIPVALALISSSKDYVLARNLLPALIPLLVVVAIGLTLPAAKRLGAIVAAGLVVYSLGFSIAASALPQFQRPDWDAVASRLGPPEGPHGAPSPRAMVTWTLGEAPLRYYLSTGSFQVRAAERIPWMVSEVDLISQGNAPRPVQNMLGPRFTPSGSESVGPLLIRRYSTPGPGLAPLRLRRLRHADLNFRTNGVLMDGVGPG